MEEIGNILILLIAYVYFTYSLYTIAKKLNVKNPRLAFIPIAQAFTMLAAAKKPMWWFILMLIPLVNIVIAIMVWATIAVNLGKSKWHGLWIMLPVIQIFSIGMLAYTTSTLAPAPTTEPTTPPEPAPTPEQPPMQPTATPEPEPATEPAPETEQKPPQS